MINLIVKLLIPVLSFIRKSLIIIKFYTSTKNQRVFEIYEKEEIKECYEHFKKFFSTSVFLDESDIKHYAIKKALLNDKDINMSYLEFGVFKGYSTNIFATYVKELYAFDSFEGLRDDWKGFYFASGKFNLNKKIPKLKKNVTPIVGWIEDTLEKFLSESHKINFIHIDVDTYETTKFILEKTKPFLQKGAIINFDELYNFPGWRSGEYRALCEVFSENEYEFLAFSIKGEQSVIKIL